MSDFFGALAAQVIGTHPMVLPRPAPLFSSPVQPAGEPDLDGVATRMATGEGARQNPSREPSESPLSAGGAFTTDRPPEIENVEPEASALERAGPQPAVPPVRAMESKPAGFTGDADALRPAADAPAVTSDRFPEIAHVEPEAVPERVATRPVVPPVRSAEAELAGPADEAGAESAVPAPGQDARERLVPADDAVAPQSRRPIDVGATRSSVSQDRSRPAEPSSTSDAPESADPEAPTDVPRRQPRSVTSLEEEAEVIAPIVRESAIDPDRQTAASVEVESVAQPTSPAVIGSARQDESERVPESSEHDLVRPLVSGTIARVRRDAPVRADRNGGLGVGQPGDGADSEGPPPPAIRVTIGRVDVRMRAPMPTPPAPLPFRPRTNLDDYLANPRKARG